jgi:TolB-like protein/Tfp pilus assembly protein PilF
MKLHRFFSELERRKVYKAAIAYGISAWVLAQIVGLVADSFELPSWVMKMTIILLVIGFLTTMVLSWIFDIGLKGIEKTAPETLDISDKNKPMTGKLVISFLVLISVLVGAGWWTWQELVINKKSPIRSLAILPFDNFSNDKNQEFIASGLQDNLITTVSKISSLRVTSRPSTIRYKNSDKSSSEIAEELKVDAIIDASIMNFGDTVRISIQLIKVYPEEQHLWTQIFERPTKEIYALFNDVTQALAKEINLVLTPEEKTLFSNSKQVDPEAYKAYLNGRFYWDLLTNRNLQKATEYYQLAIKLDSNFTLPYLGIAATWGGLRQIGLIPTEKALVEATKAIEKAYSIDSLDAQVLSTSTSWMTWDWERRESDFKKKLELNPSDANAHAFYSNFLIIFKRNDEATYHMKRALELDPYNGLIHGLYMINLFTLGHCDEVITYMNESGQNHPLAKNALGGCNFLAGNYDKEIELMISRAALRGDKKLEETIRKGYDMGGYVEATTRVAELLESRSQNSFVPAAFISIFYAKTKQKEKTLEWLEMGLAQYDANLPYITVNPIYDFLRDEPRFKAILRKMNLPE